MFGDGYTRIHATATGFVLVVSGLLGFLAGPEFENPELTGSLLGLYAVNGWANSLHLAIGLIALALAPGASRLWAFLAAVVFTGLGLWGVLAPDGTLLAGVLPATRTVNLINLLIGLSAVAALLAGPLRSRAERSSVRKRARRVRPRVKGSTATGAGTADGATGATRSRD